MNANIFLHGKKALYIGVFLIFILALCFRFYRLEERKQDSFFLDESFSIVLSNYGSYGWTEPYFDDSRMFTGKEVKAKFFSDDNSLKEVLLDVKRLWVDNRDEPHTNAYYSLLRVSFLGADTGEVHQIMNRAFALNLFLFSIGFFVLLLISRRLFDANLLIWATLTFAFVNPVAIVNTLLFRPYQFQELMFILLIFVVAHFYFKIKNKEKLKGYKSFVLSALVLALAFLAGYFGVAFVFLVWFILIGVAILSKQKESTKYLLGVLFLSFVFVFMLYPNFLVGFFNYRSEEAFDKFNVDNFLYRVYKEIIRGSFFQFNKYFLSADKILAAFTAIALALFFHWKENRKFDSKIVLFLILLFSSFAWMALVMYFSPWVGMRYFMSVIPIACLAMVGLLSCSKYKVFHILILLIPLYTIYRSTLITDYYYEDKDKRPIIIGGDLSSLPLQQVAFIHYYSDDRLVGYTLDKNNFEEKMNSLEGEILLYIDKTEMPNIVDTTRYSINEQSIGYPGGVYEYSTFYITKRSSVVEKQQVSLDITN